MRIQLFTLALLLGVSLVGCGDKDAEIIKNTVDETLQVSDSVEYTEETKPVVKTTEPDNVRSETLSESTISENTIEENTISESIEESTMEENTVDETESKNTVSYSFPFTNHDLSQPFLNRSVGKWVILDVDMNTDVDDVCAVRMATALDDLGVIDLKGVMYCVDNSSYGALRGILHHDGKDDVLMGQGTEDRHESSPYWNELGKHNDFGGDWGDAVRQYRRILAEATSPVDIVTTGMLTNLEALLKSQPDDISPLTGKELVWSKVGQLYVTGGDHPTGWSNNLALTEVATIATKYVTQNWGLPIIFSPGNYAGHLICGGVLTGT